MHRVDGRNYFGFVLQSALVSHRVDGVNYFGFVQQIAPVSHRPFPWGMMLTANDLKILVDPEGASEKH